ncbi:MAG: alkaline phosphatase PhoX [Gemmatimonadales bacterium]
MHRLGFRPRFHGLAAAALLSAACADDAASPDPVADTSPLLALTDWDDDNDRGRAFHFTPVPASAACTDPRAATEKPFVLPAGFEQVAFAREGDGGTIDLWDMHTQNETGSQAGRFLYRTHEPGSAGQVSVTDLKTLRTVGGIVTSDTRILAQRADWERFDGIVWTPWKTILAAEEVITSTLKDPELPLAKGGHVYEIDPKTGAAFLRAAVGSRSHEGLRFDPAGNLYGISEASPPTGGYIYKFVPQRRGDLSTGRLYALKIVESTGDRTGRAVWVLLDGEASKLDSDAEATRVGATGYGRPEDVETATSTGTFDPWILFVAITSENRVLAIDLKSGGGSAFVYDYVRAGVNAPADFGSPDNLALDKAGNLYITEDPSVNPVGADVWTAEPPRGRNNHQPARRTVRFASLANCLAEPSGIYFDLSRSILYIHVMHPGGAITRDFSMMIYPAKNDSNDDDEDDDDD